MPRNRGPTISESEAYRRTAERNLEMAGILFFSHIEGALFHTYHALESVACAAIASARTPVPTAHRRKLSAFTTMYGRRFPQFAPLAFTLLAFRNDTLYPRLMTADWQAPDIAAGGVKAAAVKQTAGMVRRIIRDLGL